MNTACFTLFLLIIPVKSAFKKVLSSGFSQGSENRDRQRREYSHEDSEPFVETRLSDGGANTDTHIPTLSLDSSSRAQPSGELTIGQTARLSLEFCLLWFAANYTVVAGLEYTTVASSTILVSTSGVWTLLFGSLVKIENFSPKKVLGVIISLLGVVLISMVDLSGDADEHRGSFPHKSTLQMAIGDILSLGSAVLYGAYSILMKKRIGSENRANMLLFFGFVGLINLIILWPGIAILHLAGIETFEMPPTTRVLQIILVGIAPKAIFPFVC